jgi:hypothetical protein
MTSFQSASLAVEATEPVVNAGNLEWHKGSGVTERRAACPGKAADELQRHGKALLRVVDGRDFQCWKVVAFAKHVDTHDNACFAVE